MKDILDPTERGSSAWQKVRAHIEDRIAKTQIEINKPGTPHEKTEGLRYLLSELKLMLELDREPIKFKPGSAEALQNRKFPA